MPREVSKKESLVKALIAKGAIRSPEVAMAFLSVDRGWFVRDREQDALYSDVSIITRQQRECFVSSSTAPSLMADMIERLDVKERMNILEIGAGTGYNAAILAELVGPDGAVVTLDIDETVVAEAGANLANVEYPWATAIVADGSEGFPSRAPYDRITSTCAVREVPTAWVSQLADGGVIAAPIRVNGTQVTAGLRKAGGILCSTSVGPGGYMEIRSMDEQHMLRPEAEEECEVIVVAESAPPSMRNWVESMFEASFNPIAAVPMPIPGEEFGSFSVYLGLCHQQSADIYNWTPNGLRFGGNAFGLVDLPSRSASLLFPSAEKLFSIGPRGDALHSEIRRILQEWDDLGRPTPGDLQVLVGERHLLETAIERLQVLADRGTMIFGVAKQ